jgi:hypothetical protein
MHKVLFVLSRLIARIYKQALRAAVDIYSRLLRCKQYSCPIQLFNCININFDPKNLITEVRVQKEICFYWRYCSRRKWVCEGQALEDSSMMLQKHDRWPCGHGLATGIDYCCII